MKKAILLGLLLAVLFVIPANVFACDSTTDPNCPASQDPNSPFYGAKAGAEAGWFNPTPQSFSNDLYSGDTSEVNSSRWINNTAASIGLSIAHQAIGLPGNPTSVQASAVGFLARGIDTLAFNPPASSVQYIAYMGKQFHIPGTPTTAYAADVGPGGRGFSELGPVLKLWTIARNLAYLVFAVIFVIIGLMIMLRVKIDPKTAATIQNSLPKVIISLVLVTFSYAIAGFLIDIMYVVLALIVALIGPLTKSGAMTAEGVLNGSVFEFAVNGGLFDTTFGAAKAINDIVTNTFLAGIKAGGGSLGGLIAGSLAFVIIAIAILVALFRTWLSLIGAYANIILAIIGAPLMLMIDAIPGQNQFNSWVRSMLSNLMAFPVVLGMLAVGSAITQSFQSTSDPGFVPPLIGVGSLSAAAPLIGLGILLSIPKAVNIVQELMKTPPFKYGNAWSESLKAGSAASIAGATGSYGYGRDRLLGQEALRWQKEMKPFKEGMAPPGAVKPSRLSKGGIGDLLGAKPS